MKPGIPYDAWSMSTDLPLTVTVEAEAEAAIKIDSVLTEMGLSTQRPGPARSSAEAVTVIIAIVPSIAILTLLLEKLRRLRLPRTYVVLGEDQTVDIYTDERIPDGRIVVLQHGQAAVELPDQEITVSTLLRQAPSPDG
jgi:hypothetical protein